MKITFFFMALFLTSNCFAEKDIPLCSMYYYSDAKKLAEANGTYDKFKHCSISCILAVKCPDLEVAQVGIFKELYDLVGPGEADFLDIEADFAGIDFVEKKKAKTDKECLQRCDTRYPKNTCPIPK